MSHSENKPKTTQTSSTTVTNLNIQDTEGVTIANSEGVQVTATDHGAIEVAGNFAASAADAASQISRDALDLGIEAINANTDVVNRGQETNLRTTEAAFDFGREVVGDLTDTSRFSLTESLDFGRGALDTGAGFFEGALDAARGFFSEALQVGAGALESAQEQVADTTAALGSIARDQSTSEASRLQQVVLYALGAVALIVIFGRGRG